jgi:hypothetical protein
MKPGTSTRVAIVGNDLKRFYKGEGINEEAISKIEDVMEGLKERYLEGETNETLAPLKNG